MWSEILLTAAVATAPLPIVEPQAISRDGAQLQTLHMTQTYLRAAPGKRAALIEYIKANWFAMDRIGIARGLFTNYALLVRQDDLEADWDVVVTVGYPTVKGHDAPGVADAFKAIRAAHREIKIDGLGQKDLGAIVKHQPLVIVYQG